MLQTPSSAAFRGRDRMLAVLDEAVAGAEDGTVTARVRDALCALMADPGIGLPEAVYTPAADHYARRELHRSPVHGYSLVAMTWGPGQGTPLHDHAGLWCVEGIWHGALEITQYALLEVDGDRARFRRDDCVAAGSGSAGSLIPPHEYHTIRNPSEREIAVSLHVYAGPLDACTVFEPQPDGSYLRVARTLARDA